MAIPSPPTSSLRSGWNASLKEAIPGEYVEDARATNY